jgi:hypothetical protein
MGRSRAGDGTHLTMQYGSSFADGAMPYSTPMGGAGGAAVVLPAPPPTRMHWSTLLFAGGMLVCFVALLATIAGIPGSMGYDADAKGVRNDPDTSDPMALSKSLDANMKWIDEHSADVPGGYVGYIKSVNDSEAAIPVMVTAMGSMDTALKRIELGMGGVIKSSTAMNADLGAMTKASQQSAATMQVLAGDVGFIAASMGKLNAATKELTTSMGAIQREADGIANTGTSKALSTTKELNAALPEGVPTPTMENTTGAVGGGGVDDPRMPG